MTHIAAFVAPVLTEKKDAYLAIAEPNVFVFQRKRRLARG